MKVLAVKFEKELEENLKNVFEEKQKEINFIDNYDFYFDEIKKNKYNAVLLEDKNLTYDKLTDTIEKTISLNKKLFVIVMGENADLKTVAGTIKAGAYDYVLKPVEGEKIIQVIDKALKDQKLKSERINKKDSVSKEEEIIGSTEQMIEIYKLVGKLSESNVPVIIKGQTGTGKELVAKAIHKFSDRQEMKFISVNCNSANTGIMERRLFGYEKILNDGRVIKEIGELELANGGTLFLDEVADLSIEMQSKLLLMAQEKEFMRVGGNNSVKVDLRVIASSSKDIDSLIVEGKFREELYHKLKVVEIEMPPLSERKDDIPLLVQYFIKKFNDELNKNIKGVSKPALTKLIKYDWPGNVREFKNAIKSSMALCRGSNILVEELPGDVVGAKISKRHGDLQDWVLADWIEGEIDILKNNNKKNYFGNIISRVERELIRQVLEATNGKKVETAEILGITRNTLRTKMNNYGLD